MTYLSECLADSPSMIYPMSAYSSGFADSSGNSRDLNVLSGTAPTTGATGPDSNAAASWGTSAGHLRSTYSQTGPTVGTYEFWFRYASAPAANVILASWGSSPGSSSNGGRTYVALLTTGKISFSVNSGGSTVAIDSPSALSANTWHHVICSWGTGGMTMRIDKSTVITGALTSANVDPAVLYVHGYWSGSATILQTAAVDMAWTAFYPTKLSDTRTDAHYDTMIPPSTPASGTASLSLSASGAAGATGAGSATLSLSASGGTSAAAGGSAALSLSASGALTPPVAASGSASLSLSASGGASGSPGGTASLNLIATGTALAVLAASGSATLTLTASGSAVMSAGGTAVLTLTAGGVALALYETDTSNALDGLDLLLTAQVIFAAPVATPPTPLSERYDVSIPYPVPVMVDGRPT